MKLPYATFLGLLFCSPAFAQVELTLLPTSPSGNPFQVEMHYHGQQALRVVLEAVYQLPDGEVILRQRSASLLLQPGRQRLEGQALPVVQQGGEPAHIQQGSYSFCLRLLAEDNGQEWARTCGSRRMDETAWQSLPRGPGQNPPGSARPWQSGGQFRLSSQLANQADPYSLLPANYLRLEAQASLSAFGIPLRGSAYLSTEAQGLAYDLNALSLQLDPQALLKQLSQQAWQQVQQNPKLRQQVLALRDSLYQQARRRLAPVLTQGPDSSLQAQLAKLKQLRRLEQMLQNPTFRDLAKVCRQLRRRLPASGAAREAHLDSLKSEDLMDFRHTRLLCEQCEEWQRLQARCQKLQALAHELKPILQGQQRLQELEQLKTMPLQDLLQNPAYLKQLGLLNQGQRLLASVRQFGIGVVFPFYSPYSLAGTGLKGVEIEINPGHFYAAFSAGQLNRQSFLQDSAYTPPQQRLVAGRLGWGQPETTHLYATLLYGGGPETSSRADSSFSPFFLPAPKQNLVYGLTGQWLAWDDKLQLQGEWLQSHRDQGLSGQAWAIRLRAQPLSHTQLRAQIETVSADYYSLGAPWLITDRQRYALEARQTLWQGRLSLTGYLKRDADLFQPYKPSRYTALSAGLQMGLRSRQGAFVQLNYAPFYRDNARQDSLQIAQRLGVWTLSGGLPYHLGATQGQTSLSASQQLSRNLDGSGDFAAWMLNLNQTLSFAFPLSLRASATWLRTTLTHEARHTWSLDFAASSTLARQVQASLGAFSLREQANRKRQGAYLQLSLPLGKHLRVENQLQYNYFEPFSPEQTALHQYQWRSGVAFNW